MVQEGVGHVRLQQLLYFVELLRAFFLDGEEIFVAAEGELIKKRYRVVQIDTNSVIMEDTEYKNNRQTLPLQAEFSG